MGFETVGKVIKKMITVFFQHKIHERIEMLRQLPAFKIMITLSQTFQISRLSAMFQRSCLVDITHESS
jgi:hypothetical protein